ncbi:hypothetical protein CEXT_539161 [Caerostris extrusa]|uniref:Uncharacterized protein n=1 Tax=Caerostris extrusa TaxID=172846 RepID=A0AAV4WN84_CAEEX|nr:hypothetical protein CEXT_539161 [Caerostris extrusa]
MTGFMYIRTGLMLCDCCSRMDCNTLVQEFIIFSFSLPLLVSMLLPLTESSVTDSVRPDRASLQVPRKCLITHALDGQRIVDAHLSYFSRIFDPNDESRGIGNILFLMLVCSVYAFDSSSVTDSVRLHRASLQVPRKCLITHALDGQRIVYAHLSYFSRIFDPDDESRGIGNILFLMLVCSVYAFDCSSVTDSVRPDRASLQVPRKCLITHALDGQRIVDAHLSYFSRLFDPE